MADLFINNLLNDFFQCYILNGLKSIALFDRTVIEYVKETKYLGIILDSQPNLSKQIYSGTKLLFL